MPMIASGLQLLAQDQPEGGWSDLLYLLLVIILPALGHFGAWIRKKYIGGEEEGEEGASGAPAGEVVIVQPGKPPGRVPVARARPLTPAPQRPTGPPPSQGPPGPPMVARPVSTPPTPPPARARPARLTTPPRTPVRPATPPVTRPAPAPGWGKPTGPGASGDLVESGRQRILHADQLTRFATVTREGERFRPSVRIGALTPEDLRLAIVLKEVLGPPVALRRPGEASWDGV